MKILNDLCNNELAMGMLRAIGVNSVFLSLVRIICEVDGRANMTNVCAISFVSLLYMMQWNSMKRTHRKHKLGWMEEVFPKATNGSVNQEQIWSFWSYWQFEKWRLLNLCRIENGTKIWIFHKMLIFTYIKWGAHDVDGHWHSLMKTCCVI